MPEERFVRSALEEALCEAGRPTPTMPSDTNPDEENNPEAENSRTSARYETLLQVCREAFADKSYDASYHALAAALHCAIDMGDTQKLSAVESLAAEQLAGIDAASPAYHHSTQASAGRNHSSPLAALARQAYTHLLMLKPSTQNGKRPERS